MMSSMLWGKKYYHDLLNIYKVCTTSNQTVRECSAKIELLLNFTRYFWPGFAAIRIQCLFFIFLVKNFVKLQHCNNIFEKELWNWNSNPVLDAFTCFFLFCIKNSIPIFFTGCHQQQLNGWWMMQCEQRTSITWVMIWLIHRIRPCMLRLVSKHR